MFGPDGTVRKYSSAEEILREFFPVRLTMYEKRRLHLLKVKRPSCRSSPIAGNSPTIAARAKAQSCKQEAEAMEPLFAGV